jgi:hypothetical protein
MGLNFNPSPMRKIPEIGLVIHDLHGTDVSFIDEYLAIHNELLPEYSRYAPVMRLRAEKPVDESATEKWHQWLLEMGGRSVGMIEFLYNRKRNAGILLDFAIHSNARDIQYQGYSRLAGLVLELAMRQLTQDANLNGHAAPLCMIAEVDHAPLVQKYKEYGYVEFPIEYFEPPATPELENISTGELNFDKIGYKEMHLGAFQIPGHPFDPSDPNILKTVLLTLWEDHYCLPADHWLVQKIV